MKMIRRIAMNVGRTPSSAPDPQVPASLNQSNGGRRGVGRGPGGPPHIGLSQETLKQHNSYWSRSTVTGSTIVARRAGTAHATRPTTAIVKITADITNGSSGFTP